MKNAPRVSVVTPTYNSAAYLASTVESVRAQTFADWELVLFDDGSLDDSVTVSKEFSGMDPRIRVVLGKHGGIASARNGGFRETHPQSEFITFLDSDDTWEPDALTLLLDALKTHPGCPAAHGLARAVDLDGKQFVGDNLTDFMRHRREIWEGRYRDVPISAPTSFRAELVDNYVVTPGTSLIRRSLLDALGGFAPTLAVCEDWDMNLRIARRGGFALVNEVILNWRRHAGSVSNTTHKRWRKSYVSVLKRATRSTENTAEQRQAAESLLLRKFRDTFAAASHEVAQRRVRAAARSLLYTSLYISLYAQSRVGR